MDKDKQKELIIELMNTENILPLTPEQFKELKEVLDGISTHIPEHQLGYIWNNYNKLQGGKAGPQPCACASSAKYWRAAVNDLKAYVESNG